MQSDGCRHARGSGYTVHHVLIVFVHIISLCKNVYVCKEYMYIFNKKKIVGPISLCYFYVFHYKLLSSSSYYKPLHFNTTLRGLESGRGF